MVRSLAGRGSSRAGIGACAEDERTPAGPTTARRLGRHVDGGCRQEDCGDCVSGCSGGLQRLLLIGESRGACEEMEGAAFHTLIILFGEWREG